MLYSAARAYEAAFVTGRGLRDVGRDVRFLRGLVGEGSGTATAPWSMLELGAGPAAHCVEAARAHGATAVALDSSAAMLDAAARRAEEAGVADSVATVRADMAAFDVHRALGGRRGFGAVAVLFNTLAHLVTDDDLHGCLRRCRECVLPGGAVVIELAHPQALLEEGVGGLAGEWRAEEPEELGGLAVDVRWGEPDDEVCPETHVLTRTVTLAVEGGPVIRERVPMRLFTVPELRARAQLAGLRVDALLGALDPDVPFDDPEADRLVLVLRRDDGGE